MEHTGDGTSAAKPVQSVTNDPAAAGAEEVFATREGLDGLRSTIAELHVHRALLAVDSSAIHVGGNRRIRDHEVLDGSVWVNTKTAFPIAKRPELFAFSHVNWSRARDIEKPEMQLHLIALVELYASDLTFRDTDSRGIEVRWPGLRWWLFPASVLYDNSHPDGKSTVRDVAPISLMNAYELSETKPLSLKRLKDLVELNEPLG